jgi:exoribonuclease-2
MSSSAQATNITSGCIVEFLQNNQPIPAWVLEVQNNRLRLLNINKREIKLPAARALPWSGPCYPSSLNRQEILEKLQGHNSKREKISQEIDPLEIWSLAHDEIQTGTVKWFAGLLWDDAEPDQIAALGRLLLNCRTHFKFNPPQFEVFPQEIVDQRIKEQEKLRKQEWLLSNGQSFLKTLWEKRTKKPDLELPALNKDLKEELQQILLGQVAEQLDNEQEALWKQLRKGLPDDPHLALLLAQTWGLLGPHHNYLLQRAAYEWSDQWSEEFADDLQRVEASFKQQSSEPEDLPLISVDSATTQDIDDAFGLEKRENGNYQLNLALACPTLVWEFGSALDQAVANRATSLYLPEGSAHMLPERLSTGLLSLHATKSRPALLLRFELDPEGNLLDYSLRQSWVKVDENLTYTQVEKDLNSEQPSPQLRHASQLALNLRDLRVKNGAVLIEQKEPSLILEHTDTQTLVHLEEYPDTPLAQNMVSEFMILANRVLAQWALDKQVPLIFKTQDISLSKSSAGVWNDPVDIFRLVRSMSSAKLDVQPRPHASLAARAYTPVTSPLRRYSDFMNMAQVVNFLNLNQPYWSFEELEKSLPYLNARLEQIGQVQRFRPRYWKLLYFKQQKNNRTWSAVVVEEGNQYVTMSLPREQILVRAPRQLFGDKVFLGSWYQIKMGKIDPLNNEIKIVQALEE